MKRVMLMLACIGLWGPADSAGDALMERARASFAPIPQTAPEIADNPITDAKVELGRMLYFEPRLSSSWLISCNTCHGLGTAGVDLQETSIGHGWQKGPRNAPTVLNAVFNSAQFWDGRAENLKEQAKGPVQAAVEMNSTPERVVETLASMPEYRRRFADAFGPEPDPVTFENMARAIEAFEATLLTPGAPFDRYLAGDAAALSDAQADGLRLFMDRGCVACHSGINAGGNGYFRFGLAEPPAAEVLPEDDPGRYQVTRADQDRYVFRSPALRNVALTYPYFHSGRVWELDEAVAIMGSAQLGIELADGEAAAIAGFLESLTGEQPVVAIPVLPPATTETPRPAPGSGSASR